MINKKLSLFSLLILGFIFNSIAQIDYFVVDSIFSNNIKWIVSDDITNSKIIRGYKKDSIVEYKPNDLTEYGYKNGKIYVSKDITINNAIKKVFLERLKQGDITLYYYKHNNGHTFFIEKDSLGLIEIPKKDSETNNLIYKSVLVNNLTNCNLYGTDVIMQTKYNKTSLKTLIENYNNCDPQYNSFKQFGLLFGAAYSQVKIPGETFYTNQFLHANSGNGIGFLAGGFIDIPIYSSQYSFHPEMYYSFSSYHIKDDHQYPGYSETTDIKISLSSINIPILIRYKFRSNKSKPFIHFGPIVKFNITNNHTIEEDNIDFSDIQIINKQQSGVVLGVGIEMIKNKFIELRYSHFSSFKANTVSNNYLSFALGYNLNK